MRLPYYREVSMFKTKYVKSLESENKRLTNSVQYHKDVECQLNKALLEQRHQDMSVILDLKKDNYQKSSLLAAQEDSIDVLTAKNKRLQKQIDTLMQDHDKDIQELNLKYKRDLQRYMNVENENRDLMKKLKKAHSYPISELPQAFSGDIIAAIRDEMHSYDF